MAQPVNGREGIISVCINDILTDDELREILAKLGDDKEKDVFGLVCKRWLCVQSSERKKLRVRAGPFMLRKLASRFICIIELDLSQSTSRSFYPGVTDSDLSVVASSFRSLEVLTLRNCQAITDNGIVTLGNGLSLLQSFDASYSKKLSDKGLIVLSKGCPNLRRLGIAGCRLVTNRLLQALSENCCHLEELVCSGCSNVDDNGLNVLVDGCRHIKFLDFDKCFRVTDQGIMTVTLHCSSSLRGLSLLDCNSVGDESMVCLAQNCKNLETLVIGGCLAVSDESIRSLAFSCGDTLKSLRMDSSPNITDSSLRFVLSRCKKLEILDIGYCIKVTDIAFSELERMQFASVLKVFKASGCFNITVAAIRSLLESCKFLKYLDLRSCPHVTEANCTQAGLKFPQDCKVNFNGGLLDRDVMASGMH